MQKINPHGVSKTLLVQVSTGQNKTTMKFVADSSASLRLAKVHCVQSYHLESVQHVVPDTVIMLFTCSWRPPSPWIRPWPCCLQYQLLPVTACCKTTLAKWQINYNKWMNKKRKSYSIPVENESLCTPFHYVWHYGYPTQHAQLTQPLLLCRPLYQRRDQMETNVTWWGKETSVRHKEWHFPKANLFSITFYDHNSNLMRNVTEL